MYILFLNLSQVSMFVVLYVPLLLMFNCSPKEVKFILLQYQLNSLNYWIN